MRPLYTGFVANHAPRPKCCSDRRYLCANCTRLAQNAHGGPDILDILTLNDLDDEMIRDHSGEERFAYIGDALPTPTMSDLLRNEKATATGIHSYDGPTGRQT